MLVLPFTNLSLFLSLNIPAYLYHHYHYSKVHQLLLWAFLLNYRFFEAFTKLCSTNLKKVGNLNWLIFSITNYHTLICTPYFILTLSFSYQELFCQIFILNKKENFLEFQHELSFLFPIMYYSWRKANSERWHQCDQRKSLLEIWKQNCERFYGHILLRNSCQAARMMFNIKRVIFIV